MDVRCERCSTEYELDDDSVPDAGCPVQCTTCSHTFMVTRRGVAPVVSQPISESLPSPPAADWLLETSDGRLHRFRNLTSLQKWIIERKVTREDKISRTGQAWRRLGEIVELSPFFDVVDEADRARAGQAGSDELKAEAQRARNLGSSSRPTPVPPRPSSPSVPPPQAVREPTPVRSRPAPPPTPSQELSALDSWAARGNEASGFEEESETSVVPLPKRGFKVVVAVTVAAAVAGGIIFYQRHLEREANLATADLALLAPPEEISPKAEATKNAATTAVTKAPEPVPTAAVASPPAAVPPAPTAATPAAVGTAPAAASDELGPGYERALAEADRLLENGSTEKAFKLYDKALKLRPDGAEALAGLGYVMLDKDRAGPAVAYFEKALAQAPSFGPAVFGLGEALRANGQDGRALEMYRRYLQINGSGPDAPAARRQAALLEDKAKTKAAGQETSAVREETVTPPSAGPAPSASSVLDEPASP
jgi:predicted Zn finger-like uncharacterized protein